MMPDEAFIIRMMWRPELFDVQWNPIIPDYRPLGGHYHAYTMVTCQ